MYSTNFYPDGWTEGAIDVLIAEAFESADEANAVPTSALLDGTAIWRRNRRMERRAVSTVVRTLPVRVSLPGPDGMEAA
jgi:hypothetical protein